MTDTLPGGLKPLNLRHAWWCRYGESPPRTAYVGECYCGDQRFQDAFDDGLADGQFYERHGRFPNKEDDRQPFSMETPTFSQRMLRVLLDVLNSYGGHQGDCQGAPCKCGFETALAAARGIAA